MKEITNFIYDELYFESLSEVVEYNNWDIEYIQKLPEGFKVIVTIAELEQIVTFTPEMIVELIQDRYDERFSENNDELEANQIMVAASQSIDFEKLNSMVPKLFYPTYETHAFSKSDLIKCFDNERHSNQESKTWN